MSSKLKMSIEMLSDLLFIILPENKKDIRVTNVAVAEEEGTLVLTVEGDDVPTTEFSRVKYKSDSAYSPLSTVYTLEILPQP